MALRAPGATRVCGGASTSGCHSARAARPAACAVAPSAFLRGGPERSFMGGELAAGAQRRASRGGRVVTAMAAKGASRSQPASSHHRSRRGSGLRSDAGPARCFPSPDVEWAWEAQGGGGLPPRPRAPGPSPSAAGPVRGSRLPSPPPRAGAVAALRPFVSRAPIEPIPPGLTPPSSLTPHRPPSSVTSRGLREARAGRGQGQPRAAGRPRAGRQGPRSRAAAEGVGGAAALGVLRLLQLTNTNATPRLRLSGDRASTSWRFARSTTPRRPTRRAW